MKSSFVVIQTMRRSGQYNARIFVLINAYLAGANIIIKEEITAVLATKEYLPLT
jgi:hypothetical protein